jgi:hypothetical protein
MGHLSSQLVRSIAVWSVMLVRRILMTAGPETNPTLEYGHAPRRLSRRGLTWLVWTVFAAAILVPTYGLLAPRIERRWQFLDAQQRWIGLDRAAGQSAFQETWSVSPGGFSRSSGSSDESSDSMLRQAYGMSRLPRVATLFLHGRRGAGGSERVVVVEVSLPASPTFNPGAAQGPLGITLDWYTGVPGGWLRDQSNLRSGSVTLNRPAPPPVGETAFLNGQVDANDPARFTIPFRMDSVPGVVEGRLLPDGTVAFKVVSGPLKVVSTSGDGDARR